MSLYTPAPPYRTFSADKPTLIVSWWCTMFASTIILFRVVGQLVRTDKLKWADKMALITVPCLLVRMAAVHVALLWGTNNAEFGWMGAGGMSGLERERREMGSRMVLMARVFFPVR